MRSLIALGDRVHARARAIPGLPWFTWSVRILLAIGFVIPGWTKVQGQMFLSLPDSGVTNQFLHAFDRVGHLAEFVGTCQLAAAILLLIPRTALLGALVYLPVIAGIEVITVTTDFFMSSLTPLITTLMLLGAVYLICWDWHRITPIVDPDHTPSAGESARPAGIIDDKGAS